MGKKRVHDFHLIYAACLCTAETIIVMHESRRFCARRIVETSPLAIQEIVRNNLQRAGALSDEDVDYASEISQESVGESEGSFASSDNE